jgi:hypothetical protein
MYHGDKPDIAGYLPSILKIAEDGQAIYEFLQNAVDCNSTHFYIFYNEKYFLAINNGSPFDIEGLQSILNIAQTTKKDADKIGRFGIGFKLAHRLVGKNDGTDELCRQYKGPILFSWNKLQDLESLLNKETITPIQENDSDFESAPYLLKLLLTNFPSDPNETVKDIAYQDRVLFPQEELTELVSFLNENFQQHSDTFTKSALDNGSLFFIKLGEGKKAILDNDYSELKNGIEYSMNTLKKLNKVYFNCDDIKKIPLQLEEGIIEKDTDTFKQIDPEYKDFDIKFAIGFNQLTFGNAHTYDQVKQLKGKPNFYKYFPMGDETNGFGFMVHCDSFSNEANRRKLHEDEINKNLFPEIAKHIISRLNYHKIHDRQKFLNVFACLLLSDIPNRQNNEWLLPVFYDYLLDYLKTNTPTQNGFANTSQNVKINLLKLNLNLADFGLGYIQWFEWKDNNDKILLEEAQNKLDIEEWDICNIVENANIDSINNWIANCSNEIYLAFLKELEDSCLRQQTKNKLRQIKLFQFSNGTWYSFNEIIIHSIYSEGRVSSSIYHFNNVVICNDKTEPIKTILQKLGFVISNLKISKYQNIYGSIQMPAEKSLYGYIAEKCKTNALTPEEKKKLFLNFTNEHTKFTDVGEATLKELCLFSDKNGKIKTLKDLISSQLQIPDFLHNWVIKPDEYFAELNSYLIAEPEIYPTIILNNWDYLITQTTDIKNFYEKTIYYYGLKDSNISLWKKSVKFVFTKDGFRQANQVFFNSKMVELANSYASFQNAILSIYGLPTPDKSIANYLLQEPFRFDDSNFTGRRFNKTQLEVSDIKAAIQFCKANGEQFFKNCIISKEGNNYFIFEKSDKFQITSPDEKARQFIDKHCSEKLFVLPYDFLDCKDDDGIVKNLDLYTNIIDSVEVNDLQEELIDIIVPHYVSYQAKLKFLKEVDEIRFSAESNYSTDCFAYKILDMACSVIKETSDFLKFKQKVIIESNGNELSLSDIPSSTDRVVIGETELSQSQILPNEAKNGNILSNLLEKFVSQGLPKEKLYELFGIQSEADPEQIFEILKNEYSVLENAQQLAFLLLYDKEIENVNFDQFKVETLDNKSWELKYSYYIQAFAFIGDDYLLKPQYADIKKIMSLPKTIGNTDNKILTKPYFDDDSFICPSLKSDLTEDEKINLIDFLFSEWGKETNKAKIKNIDWSKINDTETEQLLGFNPSTCVYPAEYACESEILPDYVLDWAGNSPAYKKYDDFADCNSEEEISQKLISILKERYEIKVNTDKNGRWKMDKERKVKVIAILNAHYPDLLDFNQEIATEVNVVFLKEDNKELVNLVNQTLKENNIDFADVSVTKDNSIKIKVASWIKPDMFNRIGLRPEKSISIFTPKNPTELVQVEGAVLANGYYQVTSTEFKDFFYWKALLESQNAGVKFRTKTSYYFILSNSKVKKIRICNEFKAGVNIEGICDFKYNIDAEQYTIRIFASDEAQYNAQLARIKNLFPKVSLQSSVYVYKYSLNFKSVVSGGKERIQFLSDMGVWVAGTEKSTITDLRKALKDSGVPFDKSRLSKYEGSEKMLFNSFEWLKENGIELTTPEQFDVFRKVVDIINENRTNGDLVIQEEFDFEKLKENSTEWNTAGDFTIYRYDGQMPKTVSLNEIDDYIFYRYNNDDYVVFDNDIYINSNEDTKKILQKVASDEENDFDYKEWVDLFGDSSDREKELENKIQQLERQLKRKSDADIDLGGWSNDVPSQQQKDWNLEAREIVKKELEKKGYDFTQGIGEYGIINGVKKDGVEYPLVVLSCKGGKLFVNPNQWLQLCEPNALLLGVVQGREIRSFALKQLLGISQEFNLRFKIDKMKDRNYREFAEIFHYFSGVNMQIPIDNTIGVTEKFVSFFPPAKKEEDITDTDSDSML